MAKSTSPTKLTTELLQEAGYMVELVEHRHPFNPHVTVDMLGVADLLAMKPGQGLLLVQATSEDGGGHHANRRKKVLASAKARQWVECGGRFLVVSWRRPVKGGVKQERWMCRYDELTLADFERGE